MQRKSRENKKVFDREKCNIEETKQVNTKKTNKMANTINFREAEY